MPLVELALSADQPSAQVAVRLCDVSPDGSSALVTRGTLNLTQRVSREYPTPLVPGESYQVRAATGVRRLSHRCRPQVASDRFAELLALALAIARAGDAHAHHGVLGTRAPTRPVGDHEAPTFLASRGGRAARLPRSSARRRADAY